jgi:hypothetical protein
MFSSSIASARRKICASKGSCGVPCDRGTAFPSWLPKIPHIVAFAGSKDSKTRPARNRRTESIARGQYRRPCGLEINCIYAREQPGMDTTTAARKRRSAEADQTALYIIKQRRGSAEGCRRSSASRGERPPPDLARRGGVSTTRQELRTTPNCDALPNHVLPLARFGAPPTYVTAREAGALNQQHDPEVMHLLVAGPCIYVVPEQRDLSPLACWRLNTPRCPNKYHSEIRGGWLRKTGIATKTGGGGGCAVADNLFFCHGRSHIFRAGGCFSTRAAVCWRHTNAVPPWR